MRGFYPRGSAAMSVALCFASIGCGGVQLGRVGPAFPLPSGAPSDTCERERWHELAPARVEASGMTAGAGYNEYYSQVKAGVGVFKLGDNDPEELDDLWPELQEPELQKLHQARIEPVDAQFRATNYWALGGLLGMGTGLGIAAAIQDSSKTGAAVAGISGLAIGLVAVVVALAMQPSGEDQLYADARRRLLIPGEDDVDAAARGVTRINNRQRVQCGGAPSKAPQPVALARPDDNSRP